MQQRSQKLTHPFGNLLKQWRNSRGFSQLELSLASNVSQRHISFLESGRSHPSRDMVLELAGVLEVPLRQQNLMLTAAGFAPIHTETDLNAPEMTAVRKAIDFMLEKQEPYPALVMDRYWNLLLINNAAKRLLDLFIPLEIQADFYRDGKVNLMRLTFHPQGLRQFTVNWRDVAGNLLQRLYREAIATPHGYSEAGKEFRRNPQQYESGELFEELMSYPDIADTWHNSHRNEPDNLLLAVHLAKDRLEFKFFSTIATLGTSYDITLQELRIECLFPADEATEQNWLLRS